ncbi:hypothetical protein RTP6_004818 [Batrachochytrium dendrobatidis]
MGFINLINLSLASVLAFGIACGSPINVQKSTQRLISTSEGHSEWMTREQIGKLYLDHTHFKDVTDGGVSYLKGSSLLAAAPKVFPKETVEQEKVKPMIDAISQSSMKEFLTKFSSFHTRYYESESGAESSKWLLGQVEAIANSSKRDNILTTVKAFEHSWGQSSVIARIEAAGANSTDKDILVFSAHQDSINVRDPLEGRSPGADDDGSGSASILEAYTRLLKSDFVPNRPIEFHWYSGEEAGLLGSQEIVADYMKRQVDVYANFNVDMTGFTAEGDTPVIAITTDFVSTDLNVFLRKTIETYASIKWVDTKCGYSCSGKM